MLFVRFRCAFSLLFLVYWRIIIKDIHVIYLVGCAGVAVGYPLDTVKVEYHFRISSLKNNIASPQNANFRIFLIYVYSGPHSNTRSKKSYLSRYLSLPSDHYTTRIGIVLMI